MSSEKDIVPQEHLELLIHVESLFDRIYILAGHVACLGSEELLPLQIMEELSDLEAQLTELPPVRFTFSGNGFMPAALPDGEVDTVFTSASANTGVFAGLDLAQAELFEYVSADELDQETPDGGIELLEHNPTQEFLETMLIPDKDTRLYVEFLLFSDESESNIAGSCVRANGANTYAIMDASTVVIHSVDRKASVMELVDEEDMPEELSKRAALFAKIFHKPGFKYSPPEEQEKTVEDVLELLNDEFQIDRFDMFLANPAQLYTLRMQEKSNRIDRVVPDESCTGFSLTPIRIDSLFSLTKDNLVNKRKGVVDPRAGLCVVVSISDHVRDQLGLDSNIVWVPIKNNLLTNGDFSAFFEEQSATIA